MSLKDIIITASINSIPTQSYGQKTYIASTDEQSFPIETIDGGNGGSMPNLLGQTSSIGLFVNITQSWTGSINTPAGLVNFLHEDQSEFINGEFSGSILTVTTQSLNPECWPLLFGNQPDISYSMFPYITSYTDGNIVTNSDFLGTFLNPLTAPRDGEFLVHFKANTITGVHVQYNIDYIKVARVDHEGKNNTLSLQDLTNFIWIDPTVGRISLTVLSKAEYATYYLYKVVSKTWIKSLISTTYFTDDNFLDYKLAASSTYTLSPIPPNEYIYLTQSWTTTADNANGFSNGQYVFPLSPNCVTRITASIGIYVNDGILSPFSGSASVAFTLNGYDEFNNIAVSFPAPLASNIYNLEPGPHVLTISSSTYQPIQTYKYELDAIWLESKDIASNPEITGSDPSIPQWPLDWAEYDYNGDKFTGTSYLYSLGYSNINIFTSSYSGGFYVAISPIRGVFANTGSTNPPIFKNGFNYELNVTIPTSSYDIVTDAYYGPPSADVTCSWSPLVTLPNYGSQNVIGIIPSGASGVFTFNFVIPDNGGPGIDPGANITFICPDDASIINSTTNYFTVLEVTANESNIIYLDTPIFNVTQSQIPQLSTSSIVLEPYLTENFTNSDCNVLMNNAELSEYDKDFMLVNYDTGLLIPTNQQQIISGTAEPAPVKAYNYRILSQTLPRYDGVRVTQQKENIWTPGDIAPSQTPSVTDLQTYFAYFDFIQTTSYELIGKSAAHIIYLIDKDGTIQTPTLTGSYYWNLIDNFETNKNANIIVEMEGVNEVNFIGNRSIIRPGVLPRGICASQTQSNATAFNTMSFSNTTSTNSVPNYTSLTTGSFPLPQVFLMGNTSVIDLVQTIYSGTGNITVDLNNNYFRIDTTSNITTLNFVLEGRFQMAQQSTNTNNPNVPAVIYFQESLNGTTWSTIDTKTINITYQQPYTFRQSFNSFTPIAGRYYRLAIYNQSGYFNIELWDGKTSITQTPIPTGLGTITSPYWITGSNSKNILTGSQFLQLYTSFKAYQVSMKSGSNTATNINGSGYKDFLEFNIAPSDQIRFEGDESQVYTIYNVTPGNTALYLTLDRDIVDGTDLNSFLIRRLDPHPNFITIDSQVIDGSGFIFPEYSTNELRQNFNNIIISLRERTLI